MRWWNEKRWHRQLPGIALLVELGGALLLVNGLLDSPGDADALHLGDVVAFFLILLLASLLDVVGSLAVLAVLEAALLTGDGLLDWSLGDLALALLEISADGVGDIMALPPGDGVVDSLWDLLAHLLGHLAAHGLGSWPDHGRGESLKGNFSECENKGRDEQSLHDAGRTVNDYFSTEDAHIFW